MDVLHLVFLEAQTQAKANINDKLQPKLGAEAIDLLYASIIAEHLSSDLVPTNGSESVSLSAYAQADPSLSLKLVQALVTLLTHAWDEYDHDHKHKVIEIDPDLTRSEICSDQRLYFYRLLSSSLRLAGALVSLPVWRIGLGLGGPFAACQGLASAESLALVEQLLELRGRIESWQDEDMSLAQGQVVGVKQGHTLQHGKESKSGLGKGQNLENSLNIIFERIDVVLMLWARHCYDVKLRLVRESQGLRQDLGQDLSPICFHLSSLFHA
jgi:hypothetical protein